MRSSNPEPCGVCRTRSRRHSKNLIRSRNSGRRRSWGGFLKRRLRRNQTTHVKAGPAPGLFLLVRRTLENETLMAQGKDFCPESKENRTASSPRSLLDAPELLSAIGRARIEFLAGTARASWMKIMRRY